MENIELSNRRDQILFRLENIEVKDSPFVGTLETLHELIKNFEVNFYDVNLSEITDQFLVKLRDEMDKTININNSSSFYKMLSILLNLKSQLLLPKEEIEQEDILESFIEFTEDIIDFEKFKIYSNLLTESEENGTIYFVRKKTDFCIPFDDDELWQDVDINLLFESLENVVRRMPSEMIWNLWEDVKIIDKKRKMAELLKLSDSFAFIDIVIYPESRMHLICAFIAVLEGMKMQQLCIKQNVLTKETRIFMVQETFEIWGDLDDAAEEDESEFDVRSE